jgi:MFS transporter, DHA2 family, multidrug resistance protein
VDGALKDGPAGRRRWVVLGVLCLPTVLLNVDNTVFNVAIPSLLARLEPSGTQLLWILDVYGLAFACVLLTAGALGDRFGHRRILLCGLACFGASSALATIATGPGQLIAARAATGIGAALIYPTTLAVLVSLFERGPEQARAIGLSTTRSD